MNFISIGSLTGYVKNIKLQSKWQQKKKTGDFSADETKCENGRKNEQFIQSYKEQQENNQKDDTLSAIYNKINMGSELTSDEMKYLQTKNPVMYNKLKSLEIEKAEYERRLKRCRTKEEVQKMKVDRVNASLSTINSVKNNPNIPESTKLAVASEEMRKMDSFSKIEYKFIKSGEYSRLPDKTEVHKAESDLKKAEENERAERSKKAREAGPESGDVDKKAGLPESDDEITKAEAELTPEARKVKRAKALKIYSSMKENEV